MSSPRIARALLERLASPEYRDAMLGDLEETFEAVRGERGAPAAHACYWLELLRSGGVLLAERVGRRVERNMHMKPFESSRMPIVIGLLGMVPAMALFTGTFIQFVSGNEAVAGHLGVLIHPVPLMLGLFAAVLLNLLAMVNVQYASASGALVASVQVRGRLLNLVVFVAALIMAKVILAYLLLENFRLVPTHFPQ